MRSRKIGSSSPQPFFILKQYLRALIPPLFLPSRPLSHPPLQNFTEILRALGYPRLVAVDNFRQPHFALVADILFWMTTRYEPNANISDDIDTETERVEFVTSVARLFATKAGIKLNCKRIYAADGRAVKEVSLRVCCCLLIRVLCRGLCNRPSSGYCLHFIQTDHLPKTHQSLHQQNVAP